MLLVLPDTGVVQCFILKGHEWLEFVERFQPRRQDDIDRVEDQCFDLDYFERLDPLRFPMPKRKRRQDKAGPPKKKAKVEVKI